MQVMFMLRRYFPICLVLALGLLLSEFHEAAAAGVDTLPNAPTGRPALEPSPPRLTHDELPPALSVSNEQRVALRRACSLLLELRDDTADRLIEQLLILQIAAEVEDDTSYDASMKASSALIEVLRPEYRTQFERFVRHEEATRSGEAMLVGCTASCLFSSCSVTGSANSSCKCKCFLGRAVCKCKA